MASRNQTTIRDKAKFGPGPGTAQWEKLRNFTESMDATSLVIPSTPRSQIAADKNFRLDMQGKFTSQSREFYNLQVQQGSETVFAVYVEVAGYGPGYITTQAVVYRIHQAAVHKTEHTTAYLSSSNDVKFQLEKPGDIKQW